MARNNNNMKSRNSTGGKKNYSKKPNNKSWKDNYETKAEGQNSGSNCMSPLNDFAWYNKNPNLTVAAASIPFPYRPGMKLPIYTSTTPTDVVQGNTLPGVMQINWIPSIGKASDPTDPINIVGKEVFGKVRSAFSGSLEADAPDFIIYLLALDSIFSYIGSLKRIYRTVSTYSPNNYAVPDVVMAALGFISQTNIEDLRENKMLLYQYINELVKMTDKFVCPAVFDYFNRHYWMNDNVYTDAESANSQFYVFRQAQFYKFTLLDTPDSVQAGGLSLTAPSVLPTSTGIADILYTFGKDLINALASADSSYTISGYLRRAYEGTPAFRVDEVGMMDMLTPVYVPEVLMQIENIDSVQQGLAIVTDTNITQNPKTNCLLYAPKLGSSPAYMTYGQFEPSLTVRSDTPTLLDVVEATRLTCHVKSDLSIIAGSEIVTGLTVFNNDLNPQGFYVGNSTDQINTITDTDGFTIGDAQALAQISAFDWHPKYIVLWPTSTNDAVCIFQDLHNTTVISEDVLANLHRMCLYSEFNSFAQ
uniref:Capsid protein n=1 Tax=Shelduck picobirnavirus I TaxID=2212779 RepID=A0A3G1RPH0_9VIRU|nr:MAG: capsid protein [Shelduck picobirnavirus I]